MFAVIPTRCQSVVLRSLQHSRCLKWLSNHARKTVRAHKKTVDLNVDPSSTRNIGIIAHIDAGKTTVTERLLYLAGVTNFLGNVDSGNTVTDFMDLERERGITIQSAAVTLFWRNHRINLIDTPGHVDFTMEVERCLRVLDGAVTILDASAGVQAQTLTVWRQAKKFNMPSIFFINKMDKQAADFMKSLKSITNKLNLQDPIPITAPVCDKDGRFIGVVNLLTETLLSCDQGDDACWIKVDEKSVQCDELLRAREEMISRLADLDEQFAQRVLESSNDNPLSNEHIREVLRRLTLQSSIVPVACGTALRCAQSLSPILDMVVDCLPSPVGKMDAMKKIYGSDLSALVFKIGHDKRRGQLTYIRVYTGEVKDQSSLYNANRKTTEKKFSVHIPHSDQLQPTAFVKAGNIAVLTGLNSTVTGDTLLANEQTLKKASSKRAKLPAESDGFECFSSALLSGIEMPDPVYFCSIEAPSEASNVEFEKALQELTVEDPSLRIRTDTELGQTIIEAMGELHIEIVKERMLRDYNLNVFLGPLQVAYKEVIVGAVSNTAYIDATFGDKPMRHECKISMTIVPKPNHGKFKEVTVLFSEDSEYVGVGIRENWLTAINEGCANALHTGPVAGFSVHDVEVVLTDFVASGGRLNPAVISAAASKCVSEALKKAGAHLMEPVMNVEIMTPDRTQLDAVLQEVFQRRGVLSERNSLEDANDTFCAHCIVPLAELKGFSKNLRILTSGHANLHIELAGYQDVEEHLEKEIIRQRGKFLKGG